MVNRRHCASFHVISSSMLIICFVAVLYYLAKKPDVWPRNRLLGKCDDEMHISAAYKEEFRNAYNDLMKYILHPRTECKTSAVLGGRKATSNKVDGDKVICLDPGAGIPNGCLVYSFGIANEWSFDEAARRKFGCEVHSFDPSMGINDHIHSSGVWFHNIGIADFEGFIFAKEQKWKMMTFGSILKHLGHTNRTVNILKMDIEGSEYPVLEDILNKRMMKHIDHLCVEVHLLDNPHWQSVHRLLRRIEDEGLRHFSTRNNTVMPPMRVPGFYGRYEQHFFEMAFFRI